MRRKSEPQPAWLTALAIHDAALVAAVYHAPILWGKFNSSGQAFTTALVCVAMAAAVLARWSMSLKLRPSANAVNLPVAVFLGVSLASALFSVSHHASALEVSRIATGVLLFVLVASRGALPVAPAPAVARLFGLSLLILPSLLLWSVLVAGEYPKWALGFLHIVAGGLLYRRMRADQGGAKLSRWLWEALVVAGAFVVGMQGLYEKVFVHVVLHDPTWRIFSTFFNPNPLGGFLAIMFPLALGAAVAAQTRLSRVVWVVSAIVVLVALLPTYSKGAMLALVVAAFAFSVLAAKTSGNRRRNLRLVLGVSAAAALAAILVISFSSPLRARLGGMLGSQSASNMFRMLTWRGTLGMVEAHPWIGVGPGGFKHAYMQYAIAGYVEASHQNYLQIGAEQGVLGLAAFLWLVGAALFTGHRALARADDISGRMLSAGAICGIIALLVHSFLDYDWYIGAINLVFWLLVGLLAGQASAVPAAEPVAVAAEVEHKGRRGKRHRPRRSRPRKMSLAGLALLSLLLLAMLKIFTVATRNAVAETAVDLGTKAAGRAQTAMESQDTAVLLYERDAARRYFQLATEYDPGWANAWERYGLLHGDAEGLRALKKAAGLEPTNFRWRLSLARHYEEVGRLKEAVAAYQQSLDLFPNNTRALRRLAEVHQKLGDGEAAVRVYQHMVSVEHSLYNQYRALDIDVDTEYAYAHYHLGRAAVSGYQSGQFADGLKTALFEFHESLRVIADYQIRGKRIDEIFRQVGQPREQRGRELAILEAFVRWRIAEVQDQMGDTSNAADNRELAFKLLPQVAEAASLEDGESAE